MTMSDNKPDSIDAHVGRQLRVRRLELKLSQGDLARVLRVSIQQVHKYETAKSSLPAERLVGLSQALGVQPAYFFDGLESAPALPATPRGEPALG